MKILTKRMGLIQILLVLTKRDSMNMTDHILEFEHLCRKMMAYNMKLHYVVLIFKLLDGAYMTDEERELALTVCNDLNLDRTKSALK